MKKEQKELLDRLWRVPNGESPDGNMLVEVDTDDGSDVALVYLDEDCQSLIEPENETVWGAWLWSDVSRYLMLEDIILPQSAIKVMV